MTLCQFVCTFIHIHTHAHASKFHDVCMCTHTHTHTDAGAVFSGASIVQWMLDNVDGIDTEEEAQALGQLLLDRGAIFHTEGSM